jgi:hypothetical protein
MGRERRAKRKDTTEPMTAAEARKPNGGAKDCLDKGASGVEADLMRQGLTRENLPRPGEHVRSQGLLSVRTLWTCLPAGRSLFTTPPAPDQREGGQARQRIRPGRLRPPQADPSDSPDADPHVR